MVRCQKLADLLRADQAGARFAALAIEIERQLGKYSELAEIVARRRRHCASVRAEIDGVIARSRSALFFSKHLLRGHPFSPEDLREEATVCREEALACRDSEERRDFARRALDLAMLAEAVARGREDHSN